MNKTLKKAGLGLVTLAVVGASFGGSASAGGSGDDVRVTVEDISEHVVENEFGTVYRSGEVAGGGTYSSINNEYVGTFGFHENVPFTDNMTVDEFVSNGNPDRSFATINYNLIDDWNSFRSDFGSPVTITSGFRSADHQIEASKNEPGAHTDGTAIDMWAHGIDDFVGLNSWDSPMNHNINYFDRGYHGHSLADSPNFIHVESE